MIKSKSSRTTPKGRQHAILSTVVDLNQGRKKKKQMSFGEGRERWDRKKNMSPATPVCVTLGAVRN